jgi:uncharacterized membrane protein
MRPTNDHTWEETRLATAECVASFRIWPHRSLDRKGTMALLSFVTIAGAIVFLSSPATLVLPLAIGPFLAVGALALALWCNNRAARRGEMIVIGPRLVTVTRIGTKGPIGSMKFATGWVRVEMSDHRRISNRLVLTESGRSCPIGEHLPTEERVSLARALATTLAAARRASAAH